MTSEKELHIEKVRSFVKGLVPEERVYPKSADEDENFSRSYMTSGWNAAREEMLKNIETNANWDSIL